MSRSAIGLTLSIPPRPSISLRLVAFYQAAAPVLVVLYLAVVYQARAFESGRDRPRPGASDIVIAVLVTIVLLLVAEAVALRVLLTGDPAEGWKAVVAGAISLALGLLAGLAVGDFLGARGDDVPKWASRHRRVANLTTPLLVAIGSYALLVVGT
jgi:hypothetical protein